jgi:hypothetical protein
VYFLGAGFSAPLGLPVMNNFIEKSQQQFLNHPERYEYFDRIFKLIKEISVIKNYFHADLFNIEEVLSILEMKEAFGNSDNKKLFTQFISDVITYHTPVAKGLKPEQLGENWQNNLFSGLAAPGVEVELRWDKWGFFVANLFQLVIKGKDASEQKFVSYRNTSNPTDVRYAIITVNYDRVLENVLEYINSITTGEKLSFAQALQGDEKPWQSSNPLLIKLHGDVTSGDIIAPTWNKAVQANLDAWKVAYQVLKDATQYRFVGFSLPDTDTYVKYLLKSALIESPFLKQIDVICLDPDNKVLERFQHFISLKKMRFYNHNTLNYIDGIRFPFDENRFNFNNLENHHKSFFTR